MSKYRSTTTSKSSLKLVYAGPNEKNASGRSDKYWEASGAGSAATATVRWGATGSAGQQQQTTAEDALRRAREKVRKGYVEQVVSATVPTPPRSPTATAAPAARTLQARVDAMATATWVTLPMVRFLVFAAERGMVSVDLGSASLRGAPVQAFVDADAVLWAAVVQGERAAWVQV